MRQSLHNIRLPFVSIYLTTDTQLNAHGMAGRRVLVVEDEALILLDIEEILSDLGAEIVGTTSRLDEAMNLAEEMSSTWLFSTLTFKMGLPMPWLIF